MKNSIVFYREWAGIFEDLAPEDAKRLIIALLNCTPNETVDDYFPVGDCLRPIFRPLKATIDANSRKYEETVQKRREAGLKSAEVRSQRKKSSINEETGEVYTPIDKPFSSDLYLDPVLEEDFPKNEPQELPETLTEFFDGHTEGIMRNADWNHFSDEFKDAEKIRELSGLGVVTCMTLYNERRNKLLKN